MIIIYANPKSPKKLHENAACDIVKRYFLLLTNQGVCHTYSVCFLRQ